MRLIKVHLIYHYQLLIIVLMMITINSLQLINCNQTDSSIEVLPHYNQTLMVNQSSSCNQSDTTINFKTINLTVNHVDDSNNLTQQLNIGRINTRSYINFDYNYSNSTIDNQTNQQSVNNSLKTLGQQSRKTITTTIKPEKIIIRLKRARGKGRTSTFGSEERAKAQGKSSGQSTIIKQQLPLTMNSLSLGIIIETLLLIKHQLNQINL